MKPWARWIVLLAVLCALVIAPFVVWGEAVEQWIIAFIQQAQDRPWTTAVFIGLLLAGDIFLPVPSSLLCTGAGMILGWGAGTAVCLAGLSACSAIGYLLGRSIAGPGLRRWLGAGASDVTRGWQTLGDWMIIVMRPVPVLAEASVVMAGVGRMPPVRFAVLVSLSNLGISVVYAGFGAWAGSEPGGLSFALAFFAALGLPGVAMLLHRLWRVRSRAF